jgi:hypothetical protein
MDDKMPNHPAWKKFETRVAKLLGGKRRGANTSDGRTGKNDIIRPNHGQPWFSVECKLVKAPSYGLMTDAVEQVRRSAETPLDIPIAVIKKRGRGIPDRKALVIMRLDDFADHFGEGYDRKTEEME